MDEGSDQQGVDVFSKRIEKLQQLQDKKRSQQLKPYLIGSTFQDITRPEQKQLTQQQSTIQLESLEMLESMEKLLYTEMLS